MGKINSTSTSNVADHYGMSQGGAGTGRGMGGGGGRGMGGSISGSFAQPESVQLSKEEELKNLKDQMNNLQKQIETIGSSINALEKK